MKNGYFAVRDVETANATDKAPITVPMEQSGNQEFGRTEFLSWADSRGPPALFDSCYIAATHLRCLRQRFNDTSWHWIKAAANHRDEPHVPPILLVACGGSQLLKEILAKGTPKFAEITPPDMRVQIIVRAHTEGKVVHSGVNPEMDMHPCHFILDIPGCHHP